MVEAFYSGDQIGDRRNFARITVQTGGTKLYQLPYNLYAASVFGSEEIPLELPNVKQVQWSRSTTQDFATGSFEFYNTAPMKLGDTPTRDLDNPGFYTYNRGMNQFAARWGQAPNEWSNMLVPDNILRTYEGYGFDPSVIPELDSNLMQTGVWRIDTVEYDSPTQLITVTVRDIGSILADEILFPPVVPKSFYPVSFTADPTITPGFVGPSANSTVQDTATVTRIASYAGPTDGPTSVTTSVGSDSIVVDWARPTTADSTPDNTHYGYKVTGYQVAIDGVILPKVYKPTVFTATFSGVHGIHHGNVYSMRVIAIWQELLTPKGELHFHTNVEHSVRSDFSSESIARPKDAGTVPTVTLDSININVNEAMSLAPGFVTFEYTHPGTYVVIAYKTGEDNAVPDRSWSVDVTGSSGSTHVDTGLPQLDMPNWNFLVYGRTAGPPRLVGPGDVFFRSVNGSYYAPPQPGQSPAASPKQPVPSRKLRNGSSSPLKRVQLKMTYSDSSNTFYVGRGDDVDVYGHDPEDAFKSNAAYWLSIGNITAGAGFSFEWIEGAVASSTLTSVRVHTKGRHYGVYLSVLSDGEWVQHSDTGIIPYNPDLPESHNHGNIPYAEHYTEGDTEGPFTITLRAPIPKVTRVRVTFHNLQYFDVGTFHYRAGVRYFEAFGQAGIPVKDIPKPVVGKTSGGAKDKKTAETTYTPAHIVPGLGANPGLYEDYTDIIKLFCAWGGFYWPRDAEIVQSDGSAVTYSWGVGPYGLPDVDPVLGDVDGGRVWGDFMETGTAGIAQIPTDTFTQQALMDGISYIRDIIGFIFYIDEQGAVVWRQPNYFAIGNWIGNDASVDTPPRVSQVVVLDEEVAVWGVQATLTGANIRERIFVSTTDGTTGALAAGFNPNPTGLRRVGGWTDQNFSSDEECQVMADLIAIQILFSYHTDVVNIAGYPAIQMDDQIILIEQVTGEGYYHYVQGIDSTNDLEAGGWEYDLTTNWLGARPFDQWAFDPASLSDELQTYLDAFDYGITQTLPTGSA